MPLRLGHFHADGPATDNDQVLGLFAQIKDVFVRIVFDRIDAGDRWHKRARACRDDKAPCFDDIVTRLHFGFGDKRAEFGNNVHAKAFEPFNAIHWGDLCDDIMHVIFGSAVVDLRFDFADAVFCAV